MRRGWHVCRTRRECPRRPVLGFDDAWCGRQLHRDRGGWRYHHLHTYRQPGQVYSRSAREPDAATFADGDKHDDHAWLDASVDGNRSSFDGNCRAFHRIWPRFCIPQEVDLRGNSGAWRDSHTRRRDVPQVKAV